MFPEKKFSEMVAILSGDPHILSDTHFFHDRVFSDFEPVRKTFAPSREEFDEKMAEVMCGSGPILHLGDVTINSRKPEVNDERIRWVNRRVQSCPRILVAGNHDRENLDLYEKTGWHVVSFGIDLTTPVPTLYKDAPPFLVWNVGKTKVFFSHEPVLVGRERTDYDLEIMETLGRWFTRMRGKMNVHGHTHSTIIPHPLFRNVSVEAQGFLPSRVSRIVGSCAPLSKKMPNLS